MRIQAGIRTGIEERFILVSDGYNNHYGGRQEWFPEAASPKVHKYGCGIVAAINVYLYLAKINWISRADYMILVREFLSMYPTSGFLLNTGIGILPWQMSSYIKRKCASAGISVKSAWLGRDGIDGMYEHMKKALENNTPLIWAFFNLKPSHKIQFYKYSNGEFRDTYLDAKSIEHHCDKVNSHYVTVTAVIEREVDDKLQRWVEISSWGSKYYVNYAEFEHFVREGGGKINPVNLINGYCSNILIIDKS